MVVGREGEYATAVDTRVVHGRPPREDAPRVPGGTVEMEPPPEIPRVVPGNPLLKMLPLVMVVAMVGMVALMITSGAAANPMTLLFPAMMVVSMLGMFAGGGRGGGPRTAELDESRKDYLTYLGAMRERVRSTASAQHEALAFSHPDPSTLSSFAGTSRMWERRSTDDDFVHLRVGVGDQRLATRLVTPDTGPPEGLEPVSAALLRSFVRTHAIVSDLPTAVSLRAFSVIGVDGPVEAARALVRSMVLQACTFHSPDDISVVVVVDDCTAATWDWTKWLPHHGDETASDGGGRRRLTFGSPAEAARDLAVPAADSSTGARPHRIVVVDRGAEDGVEDAETWETVTRGGDVTVLTVSGAGRDGTADRTLVLVVGDGADRPALGARSAAGVEMFGTADGVDVVTAAVVARGLARFRTGDTVVRAEGGPRVRAWEHLPGMTSPDSLDPGVAWSSRSGRSRLRVPFGLDDDGRVVELDLKEAAEGGMGPHGLCIGATGSGKSELLRTLVLGLVATHPPDVLNLVLVDFKGGATFLGLESAPHVAAVITNLSEEAQMVERMRDALAGEMTRRQELLRAAGNYANVSDYTRAREGGAALAPLPALFVVVDEFSELLTRFPEFAELFVAIGRLGRSLHIHLLLASQRLDEGRLRGLDSHLSYRIGLKTFSASESRSVLGVADAHHVTGGPGVGFLRTDSSELVRFTAMYVSGPRLRSDEPAALSVGAGSTGPRLFTAAPVPLLDETALEPAGEPPSPSESSDGGTVLSAVVARVRGHGRPAHRVWLPPLDRPVTLDSVSPDTALGGDRPDTAGSLRAVVALVDRPYDQRRDALELDLTGASGHVAIVGGPQSGKSTALCTLVLDLALRYSPHHVQFHVLDFGGGSVGRLVGLPHVGSVAVRSEADAVRRIVADVVGTVRRREELFRTGEIRSMADARRRRESGGDSAPPVPDIVLVVDGWSTIRAEFEALEPSLHQLVSSGLSYGVHVVLAASRWAELRPAVKDAVTTRVELRMGDPSDSDIGRARAMHVPTRRPGRGITPDGLHLLVALPRVDGIADTDDLGHGTDRAIAGSVHRWRGDAPTPPVRLLPRRLERDDLLSSVSAWWPPSASGTFVATVPVGVDENDLAPVVLDLAEHPHLLVLGDSGCGKTSLLRSICRSLAQANDATSLRILAVDYRRTLLGDIPSDRLAGHASTAEQATTMVAELATYLRARRPGPDTTRRELAARSWWTGPEIVVVVDDYDLVVTPHGNPLTELLELLSQARDVGLHLVVARRCGGSARALYEPVLARLKDLASPGLVMSGSREEGVLLGSVRPSELPPGRGVLVGRGTATLVQTALCETAPDER